MEHSYRREKSKVICVCGKKSLVYTETVSVLQGRGRGQVLTKSLISPFKAIWLIPGHVKQWPISPIGIWKSLFLLILCFYNQGTYSPRNVFNVSTSWVFVHWENQMKLKSGSLASVILRFPAVLQLRSRDVDPHAPRQLSSPLRENTHPSH